jgi:DNA-binding beta-propeller fold protein YncE
VVPFNVENSSLLFFINTDSSLGPTAVPTMPLDRPRLSREEYLAVRDWIARGAPDKNGRIPFATDAGTRQKIYLTQQGCDLVAVIDGEKKVAMRYISVGKTNGVEAPHCLRVSPDGMYAYVSFTAGEYVQKIDTRTDEVVGEAHVGPGSWNIVYVSPDGRYLLVSDWRGNGALALIETATMQQVRKFAASNTFIFPHGITSNQSFDTFFVTAQYGNVVFRFSPSGGPVKRISIDGGPPVFSQGLRDPHEIIMTPDYSRYFLSCEASNEVRVMDAHADTLIGVLPTGVKPQEFAISRAKPYLFVTCMEDPSPFPKSKGSVYVFNYNTLELVRRLDGKFYQPHGITVDDRNGRVYIASRNATTDGPAPHHPSACGGRNGWYSIFDLNTLEPVDSRRYEVSIEPYSADARFK